MLAMSCVLFKTFRQDVKAGFSERQTVKKNENEVKALISFSSVLLYLSFSPPPPLCLRAEQTKLNYLETALT